MRIAICCHEGLSKVDILSAGRVHTCKINQAQQTKTLESRNLDWSFGDSLHNQATCYFSITIDLFRQGTGTAV